MLAEDDVELWRSAIGINNSGVPTAFVASSEMPVTQDTGLLDMSTKLLILSLLEVSSCSLALHSLATCKNSSKTSQLASSASSLVVADALQAYALKHRDSSSGTVIRKDPPNSAAAIFDGFAARRPFYICTNQITALPGPILRSAG